MATETMTIKQDVNFIMETSEKKYQKLYQIFPDSEKKYLDPDFLETERDPNHYLIIYNGPDVSKEVIFHLKNPGWSQTYYDMIHDIDDNNHEFNLTCDSDKFNDNSEKTKVSTNINEINNGLCYKTLDFYTKFFEIFDFSKTENIELLDKVYIFDDSDPETPEEIKEAKLRKEMEEITDPEERDKFRLENNIKEKEKVYHFIFEEEDFENPDLKKYLEYIEKDADTVWKKFQILHSLNLFANFSGCRILGDLTLSRITYYVFQVAGEGIEVSEFKKIFLGY